MKKLNTKKNIWIIIITIILSSLIVGGGIYIWQKSNLESIKQSTDKKIANLKNQITKEELEAQRTESIQGYKLINGQCDKKECLFNKNNSNYPIGIATVEGYYTKYLDKAWGQEEYCDSLTLTDGTQELIDSIIRLVDKGNTVHDKNEVDQPIVNFDISNLSENDKQKFLSSSKNNPIELTIFQPTPEGVDVGVCFSSFDILEVK